MSIFYDTVIGLVDSGDKLSLSTTSGTKALILVILCGLYVLIRVWYSAYVETKLQVWSHMVMGITIIGLIRSWITADMTRFVFQYFQHSYKYC